MGKPGLNYYDTYEIKFIGKMFSGIYKVISFEHTISGNKFTTSFDAVRVATTSTDGGISSLDAKPTVNRDNSSAKNDDGGSWWDSLGFEHPGTGKKNISQPDDDETNTWYDQYGGIHRR